MLYLKLGVLKGGSEGPDFSRRLPGSSGSSLRVVVCFPSLRTLKPKDGNLFSGLPETGSVGTWTSTFGYTK